MVHQAPAVLPETYKLAPKDLWAALLDFDRVVHRKGPGLPRHISSELITLSMDKDAEVGSMSVYRNEQGRARLVHTLRDGRESTTVLRQMVLFR